MLRRHRLSMWIHLHTPLTHMCGVRPRSGRYHLFIKTTVQGCRQSTVRMLLSFKEHISLACTLFCIRSTSVSICLCASERMCLCDSMRQCGSMPQSVPPFLSHCVFHSSRSSVCLSVCVSVISSPSVSLPLPPSLYISRSLRWHALKSGCVHENHPHTRTRAEGRLVGLDVEAHVGMLVVHTFDPTKGCGRITKVSHGMEMDSTSLKLPLRPHIYIVLRRKRK